MSAKISNRLSVAIVLCKPVQMMDKLTLLLLLPIIIFLRLAKGLNLVYTLTVMDTHNKNEGRRDFLKKSTALAALAIASPALVKAGENDERIAALCEKIPLNIEVKGVLQ